MRLSRVNLTSFASLYCLPSDVLAALFSGGGSEFAA